MKGRSKQLMFNVRLWLVMALFLVLVASVAAQPPLGQEPEEPVSLAQMLPSSKAGVMSPSGLLFSYQGQLLDVSGDPVEGNLDITFHLYHQAESGTPFWTEAHTGAQAVTVIGGLFQVLLGSLQPISAADVTGDVYLELVVNGETLSPRELFASVAYAVEASTLPDGATTRGSLAVNGRLTVNGTLHAAGVMPQLQFANNDYIAFDDSTYSPGAFSFDADSGAANAFLLAGGVYLNTAYDSIYRFKAAGDAYIGGNLTVNESLHLGSDVELYRPIANVLRTDDRIDSNRTSASDWAYIARVEGDANSRWAVTADGKIAWGPGTSARDTNLYRSAANTLKTDDSLAVGTNLQVNGTIEAGDKIWAKGMLWADDTLSVYNGDIFMKWAERGDGGRALVHMNGDTLVVNYDGDFAGGVRIDSSLNMNGHGIANCGALIEANLQTEDELAAGRIDRFQEGDILCWGMDQLELCSKANDRLVQAVADSQGRPIIIGAEAIKVLGPVKRGDILVASDVPGYAIVNNDPSSGSVIAQALEDFDGKQGLIKAMIRKW
jgi:hypothetical protein